MNAGLTSQEYDFRAYEDLTFAFDLRYDTENNYDGLVVEYTTDSITWIQLGSIADDNWYNNTSASSFGAGTHAWSGDNSSWQTYSIQLPDVLDTNLQYTLDLDFYCNYICYLILKVMFYLNLIFYLFSFRFFIKLLFDIWHKLFLVFSNILDIFFQ